MQTEAASSCIHIFFDQRQGQLKGQQRYHREIVTSRWITHGLNARLRFEVSFPVLSYTSHWLNSVTAFVYTAIKSKAGVQL